MTEERLKEIKDSIYIAHRLNCDPAISMDFRDKEDLYNEVVRLRDILNKLTDYVSREEINSIGTPFIYTEIVKNIYNILKRYNLTLEQLNGVENA